VEASVTPPSALTVVPIGVIRSPFPDRASAPRQPASSNGAAGRIELTADGRFEYALADLETFSHVWVLFWFHLNEGWKSKVFPPRSSRRRGVFATRSPYRPNPIGMSVFRLERVEGLTLHVSNVDVIDGTPVLDIKPYVPYTDAVSGANHGWLGEEFAQNGGATPVDPGEAHEVQFEEVATAQMDFLRDHHGIELRARIRDVLALGASPHPYRRIRKAEHGFVLAVQEWRVVFRVDGRVVTVERVFSGYRPSVLYSSPDPAHASHRAFGERFGADGRGGS
jgi:tRNA-Thr(GGU) m(6)t(6)A37 methyltransferase TsaA